MPDLFAALLVFAAVTSFTPGPNNVMLTASGATFGFRRTLPHVLGVALGFPAMVVVVGLGLGTALIAHPMLHAGMKVIGAVYLCYLAWLVARSGHGDRDRAGGRPIGFWRAAAFQWVNPKAWIMAVGAVATFTSPEGSLAAQVLAIGAAFVLVGLPSSASWAAFGTLIGRWLDTDRRLRRFNLVMAALLVLSIVPAFL
ncbi:LysE family translocator [Arenibaculum pallidiluteum]|uniref:LysE family translocator n=1 Tax=Arenibaculum pallidiluteum TaxID=2812559 RepID=UPI001A96DB13|nr:LysE family translocator [Arenibaculum pallidiluteum]